MVINPDECIDCALCEPECPANAIKADDDLELEEVNFIDINAELSKSWPNITISKEPLADADKFKDVAGKLAYLER
jgi:ferredoxin